LWARGEGEDELAGEAGELEMVMEEVAGSQRRKRKEKKKGEKEKENKISIFLCFRK
jgi:hypothetical protein